MFKTKMVGLILVFALLMVGCAGLDPVDPKDHTLSVVYGYFDMEEAPADLNWVSIRQYKGKRHYYNAAARENSFFYHIGIEPNSYQVEKFGGAGNSFFGPDSYVFNFGTAGRNETAVRIKKPGVYFLGSYKFIEHEGGFFEGDKFEMKPSKKPTEKQVLQMVYDDFIEEEHDKEYPHQTRLIKLRLKKLK